MRGDFAALHAWRGCRGMQVKALLSLGLLAGFGAVSTLASWTGEATTTSELSAATISIGVGESGAAAGKDFVLPIDGANWYPGVSRAGMVTVKNSGSTPVPYTIGATVTDHISGQPFTWLRVKVASGSTTDGTSCTGEVLLDNPTGVFTGTSAPRELAVAGEHAVCVQYSLPLDTPGTMQGKVADVMLTFNATLGVP